MCQFKRKFSTYFKNFKKKWDAFGVVRKTGTGRELKGILVNNDSKEFDRSDFWCIPIAGNKYIILLSRFLATKTATLVGDDGRPAEQMFRGIYEIRDGTVFELYHPAHAFQRGVEYEITVMGKLQLPSNSSRSI